jgi:hypothetical protein
MPGLSVRVLGNQGMIHIIESIVHGIDDHAAYPSLSDASVMGCHAALVTSDPDDEARGMLLESLVEALRYTLACDAVESAVLEWLRDHDVPATVSVELSD